MRPWLFALIVAFGCGRARYEPACATVDCNGHGVCAVLPDGEPRCFCEPGYALRDDVTCIVATGLDDGGPDGARDSGDGARDSDAEDGHASRDADASDPDADAAADAAVAPACAAHAECAADSSCSPSTGACVLASSITCGMPAAEGGARALYELCTPETACGPGLVCRPQRFGLDRTTLQYGFGEGVCLRACDPCASTCDASQDCFPIESGGGFCHPGPLFRIGELAGGGVCVAGATSTGTSGPGICTKLCLPDDRGFLDSRAFGAGTSVQCPAGQHCRLHIQALVGDLYDCNVGELAEVGEPCGVACRYPATCKLGGICSPPDCHAAPCPTAVGCFDIVPAFGTGFSACIPDASLPYGEACAVDRNCRAGLVCAATPPSTFLRCRGP